MVILDVFCPFLCHLFVFIYDGRSLYRLFDSFFNSKITRPVVISTRVYTGRVMDLYANKGRGVSLRELGCIFADNLSPQKAQILLTVALTKTKSSEHIQQYFAR